MTFAAADPLGLEHRVAQIVRERNRRELLGVEVDEALAERLQRVNLFLSLRLARALVLHRRVGGGGPV